MVIELSSSIVEILILSLRLDHELRRWWRPLAGGLLLPDGFSIGPEHLTTALETRQLAPIRCLGLLGEAGMGKTTELTALASGCPHRLFFSLGPYRSGTAILDFLQHQEAWLRWRAGRDPLTLFIDGLDECLVAVPEVVELLISTLVNVGVDGLTLRIACRTGAWSPRLDEALRAAYPTDYALMELLPLTQEDAADLARSLAPRNIDLRGFLKELERPEISPLAARPVTLRLLVDLQAVHGELPRSRVELYRHGLQALLREWSIDRARRAPTEYCDPILLAKWIAAALVLGNRAGIAERVRPGTGVDDAWIDLPELARTIHLDQDAIAGVLCHTGVFSQVGSDKYGWIRTFSHRSFGEFLTAQWLYDRRLVPSEILSIIGNRRRVAPQLSEVASWLTGLDRAWFAALLEIQPEIVLRGDPAGLDVDQRRHALAAILDACAAGLLQDNTTGWERELWRLNFPGIVDLLAARILAEETAGETLFVARRVAIETAETLLPGLAASDPDGAVRLLDALTTTVTTPDSKTGESNVRSAAGWALHKILTQAEPALLASGLLEPVSNRLRSFLDTDLEADPEREIRGVALSTLHPRWLDDDGLVRHLHGLPRMEFSGSYTLLFWHHLPPRIAERPELARRLARWLAHLLEHSRDTSRHEIGDSFLEAIVNTLAGEHHDASAIEALARLLVASSHSHLALSFPPEFLANPAPRRELWRAALKFWTVRRWEELARRLQAVEAETPPEGVSELMTRFIGAAPLGWSRLREIGAGWDPSEVNELFKQSRSFSKRSSDRDYPIAWHLHPFPMTDEDILYWIEQALEEPDPLLRDELLDTGYKTLNVDAENADSIITEIRRTVNASQGMTRAWLERRLRYVLDDESLHELREQRRQARVSPKTGPEDGKSPEQRLAELLEEASSDPVGMFPNVLAALPLKPTDTHWSNPHIGDINDYANWRSASAERKEAIRTVARSYLIADDPRDATWVDNHEFPRRLLDACRAFHLLALEQEAPSDLRLTPEVWAKWALTLLDKVRILEPHRLSEDLLHRLARQAPDAAARVLELLEAARRGGNDDLVWSTVTTAFHVRTPEVDRALVEHARVADLPRWADRAVLTRFVADGDVDVHSIALARLDEGSEVGRVHRVNAIVALTGRGLRPSDWSVIWRILRADREMLVEVLSELRGGFSNSVREAFQGVGAASIGELLDVLIAELPLEPLEGRRGRPRAGLVTPLMHAAGARNDLLNLLAGRAHADDVDELQRIVDLHHLQSVRWLHDAARSALERRSWRPRTLGDLMNIASPATSGPESTERQPRPGEDTVVGTTAVRILHLVMSHLRRRADEIHRSIEPQLVAEILELDAQTSMLDLQRRIAKLNRTLVVLHADEDTTRLPYVSTGELAKHLDGAFAPDLSSSVLVVRHGQGAFGCSKLLGFPSVALKQAGGMSESEASELAAIASLLRGDITRRGAPGPDSASDAPTSATPNLESIFRGSGTPRYTLVETALYVDIVDVLRAEPVVVIRGPLTSGKTTAVKEAIRKLASEADILPTAIHWLEGISQQPEISSFLRERVLPDGFIVIDDIHHVPESLRQILGLAKRVVDHDDEHMPRRRLILIGVQTAIEFHHEVTQDVLRRVRLRYLSANPVSASAIAKGILEEGARAARLHFVHAGALASAARGWPVLGQHLALEAAHGEGGVARKITTTPRDAFNQVQESVMEDALSVVKSFIQVGKSEEHAHRLAFLLCWWAGVRDASEVRSSDLPDRYAEYRHAWENLRSLALRSEADRNLRWTTSIGLLNDKMVVEDILLSAALPEIDWESLSVDLGVGASFEPGDTGRWPKFSDRLGMLSDTPGGVRDAQTLLGLPTTDVLWTAELSAGTLDGSPTAVKLRLALASGDAVPTTTMTEGGGDGQAGYVLVSSENRRPAQLLSWDCTPSTMTLSTEASRTPSPHPPAATTTSTLDRSMQTPPWEPILRPDIAFLIALPEEFRVLADDLADRWFPWPNPRFHGHDFLFVGEGGYRCVATILPRMGPTPASQVSARLLALRPAAIVNIGIAGSFKSGDLRIGDVIVPRQVDAYDETGKQEKAWQRRSEAYRPDAGMMTIVQQLEFTHRAEFRRWENDGTAQLDRLHNDVDSPTLARLTKDRLLRDRPVVSTNHLASGSFVVASKPFAEWLREANADIHAGEMEAAGMMAAAEYQREPVVTLVIRGISDHVDASKSEVDAIGGGGLRRLAMENAWRLGCTLMRLNLLPRVEVPPRSAKPVVEARTSAPAVVAIWQEKLDFLLEQEPLMTTPEGKFSLKKQIEEARAKIREYGGDT